MKMNTLAGGALEVSALSLGSMTWGSTNTAAEGHAQIDMALDHGVTLIDTAEMYPVNPISADTVGRTESIIGDWLERTGRRGDVVIATKVSGANGGFVRDGRGYDGETIRQTVEASLKRLKTDYIDIYQTHWPNRGSYMFRQNWTYDPSKQNREETEAHMRDVLDALTDLVAAGKLRHFGLSNESAWGTAEWLRIAREMGAPEVVSIQNEYSLLCRLADTDLAELCVNEGVGILAFSPLGAGLLTGKYQGDVIPDGSRRVGQPELGGRFSPYVLSAVEAYHDIAHRHGLDPIHMALAFSVSRPFMASTIFGASSLAQLDRILAGQDLVLSDEVMGEIDQAHRAHAMPY